MSVKNIWNLSFLLCLLILSLLRPLHAQEKLFDKIPKIDPKVAGGEKSPPASRLDQLPDTLYPEQFPIRHIRVNVHYVGDSLGGSMFEDRDGRDFAWLLIKAANEKLQNNQKMFLPLGNNTPVYPARYEYVLAGDSLSSDGVYFHKEKTYSLRWFMNTNRGDDTKFNPYVFNQYGVRKGEVLNIFLLSHPPDSMRSATYRGKAQGVGYPQYVYMAGTYNWIVGYRERGEGDELEKTANFFAGLLNHEIGHSLGLYHSWDSQDGCDDTPLNPGCWNFEKTGPCAKEVSNNVMDYNAYQNALTPCQLSIIHSNFNTVGSMQRKILDPVWCKYNPNESVNVPLLADQVWKADLDLEGDLVVQRGARLEIRGHVSLPKGAHVIIHPKAKLILSGEINNACGESWEGITLLGKKKKRGQFISSGSGRLLNCMHPVL